MSRITIEPFWTTLMNGYVLITVIILLPLSRMTCWPVSENLQKFWRTKERW